MIEEMTIDGRKATAVYMTDDLRPTTKEKATQVKVVYQDNNETVWLRPKKP